MPQQLAHPHTTPVRHKVDLPKWMWVAGALVARFMLNRIDPS